MNDTLRSIQMFQSAVLVGVILNRFEILRVLVKVFVVDERTVPLSSTSISKYLDADEGVLLYS